ncbi:hypothetical protein [Phyllobacterium meliloti]|uniref:hypothetical protein n=1 Tax=Phyllobacterium meliloti TaxID=555317 RepID=UPI001D14B29F|nr:hypothetical protein [Phyllobacterium sp. T1293]UGX87935.1 hypothetical protein LLE53_009065 [Phyllobacterium sp. T1293]
MPYIPYRAASLLAPINEVLHLVVLMNNPCSKGQCLLINVTSIKPNRFHDPACILDVGDHPFIRRPSYLLYRMADCSSAARIGRFVDQNYFIKKEDVCPAIFARISSGIYTSDETPLRIIRYASANNI